MLRDSKESLDGIIAKLGEKYPLFHFSFLEEKDKENSLVWNVTTGGSQRVEIYLPELSDDERKKQGLALFIVPRTDQTKIDEAGNILKTSREVSLDYWNSRLPDIEDDNPDSFKRQMQTLWDTFYVSVGVRSERWTNLTKDVTYVSISDKYSSTKLYNWHYTEVINNVTVGFIFNLKENRDIACVNGRITLLSFDDALPFCVCDYGFGGDQCDVSLIANPDESLMSSILAITEKYKVPGMFDLQDQIAAKTDEILKSVEESKQEIFTEIRSLNRGLERNRNTILAAQHIVLNQMRAESNRVLVEMYGNLKTAFDSALEKMSYCDEHFLKLVLNCCVTGPELLRAMLIYISAQQFRTRNAAIQDQL